MFQLPTLLAFAGILSTVPTTGPVAIAQAVESYTEPVAEDIAVTELINNNDPNECGVQLGYFEGDDFAKVGTQSVESLLVDNPLRLCNIVTATDSGQTKNFNFVVNNSALYKIITESETATPDVSASDASAPDAFTVLAIQIVPMDEAGNLDQSETIQLLEIDDGACEVDSPNNPQQVTCEFVAISQQPSAAMGRLTYAL